MAGQGKRYSAEHKAKITLKMTSNSPDFSTIKLRGALLPGADLRAVDLRGAILFNTRFYRALIEDILLDEEVVINNRDIREA